MKEYKAIIYQEDMLSSLFLRAAKIDPVRFSDFLNRQAAQGWRVVTIGKGYAPYAVILCPRGLCGDFGTREGGESCLR